MPLDQSKCDYCQKMKDFVLRSVESRRSLRICLECHTKTEQVTPPPTHGNHNQSN